MTRIFVLALLAWLFSTVPALGQEPQAEESETPPQAPQSSATSKAESDDELPEIDVWAEDGPQETDVFIPTESISADSSIAFPSDI
jgi:hypothetical protein